MIEIHKKEHGTFFFIVKSEDGEILTMSDEYQTFKEVRELAKTMLEAVNGTAKIVDRTDRVELQEGKYYLDGQDRIVGPMKKVGDNYFKSEKKKEMMMYLPTGECPPYGPNSMYNLVAEITYEIKGRTQICKA